MEKVILILFGAALLLCLALDIPILLALLVGLALFLFYGRRRGFGWPELWQMALQGVGQVKNILVTFFLIGVLTALWRAAGTIPVIVCFAAELIQPSVFLLMTFLLNCAVSTLTGTSFGTAATMGAICAAMAATLHVPLWLVGGAVLSGVYFGDRCSPVSTSALLVAELTGTNIFDNIRRMLRSALVPFLLSCAVYLLLGFGLAPAAAALDLRPLLERGFTLHWLAVLPAAVILLLAALRLDVKLAMLGSIAAALPLCVCLQHMTLPALLRTAVIGFAAPDAALAEIMDGGGVCSMLNVAGIVCLSSSYAGIFQQTGLLDSLKRSIAALARRTTPYAATLLCAAGAAMIACNQSLAIIMTDQLCRDISQDPPTLANDLEDTAVVVSPLVPWSIACGVPLASVGAPPAAVLAAAYLYLLPLWRLVSSRRR